MVIFAADEAYFGQQNAESVNTLPVSRQFKNTDSLKVEFCVLATVKKNCKFQAAHQEYVTRS